MGMAGRSEYISPRLSRRSFVALTEFNTTMTWPKTWRHKISPVIRSVRSNSLPERDSYRISLTAGCIRARRTPLEYQRDCRLQEGVVVQGGKGVRVVFDSHG